MAAKMKGFYKGLKFITQIFVVKEREIEIGYPTDVKHVAHIGWDGASGTAPAWMNEFKTTADFSATSLEGYGERRDCNLNIAAASTWSSQDFDRAIGSQSVAQMLGSPISTDVQKKHKRKKTKSSSSPKSSSSRYPRAFNSKPTHFEMVAATG